MIKTYSVDKILLALIVDAALICTLAWGHMVHICLGLGAPRPS